MLTEVQLCGIFFPGRLPALKPDAGIPGLRPIAQPFCRVDVDAVESCAVNIIRVHIPSAFPAAIESFCTEQRADTNADNQKTKYTEAPIRASRRTPQIIAKRLLPLCASFNPSPNDADRKHKYRHRNHANNNIVPHILDRFADRNQNNGPRYD